MSIDISDGIESGSVDITVLTTNSVISTLLTNEKFGGKVIQPQSNGSKLFGEHGLAMLFEIRKNGESKKILLDTGGPRGSAIENAAAMSIDFNEIDKFVLSHGHVDHYGGMMEVFPKLREGIDVVISPSAYEQNMILIPKEERKFYTPEELSENYRDLRKQDAFLFELKLPPFKKALVDKYVGEKNFNLIEPTAPEILLNGMAISGEIELFDRNEVSNGFYLMEGRKDFLENTFRDELSIYLNIKGKGLAIITGCGHAGIVNTIKHAQKITGIDDVYAIIGGFHKEWESPEDVKKAVDFIQNLNPEITCGMHCTGFEFNRQMADHPSHAFGISGTIFHL
ncbi:MAG: putative MBL fold metallo-hydrolase [Promethearchaeota archaeon]|nr:MAG: putative MBL fold metallo-hydrolase [Candidatus Lokiarchaeota archaeon]